MKKNSSIFWLYSAITFLIIFFFRTHLGILPGDKMVAVNFGIVHKSRWLIFLNVYLIAYDLISILLARTKMEMVEDFLVIRKITTLHRFTIFWKNLLIYLIPFLIIHLSFFNKQNFLLSSILLFVWLVIWLILAVCPFKRLNQYIRATIILMILLILRILV